MDLRQSPLTESNSHLYIERDADAVVRSAIDAAENVLLAATRGSGTTSMLYRLEGALPDAVFVSGARADGAGAILMSVAARLGMPPTFPEFQRLVRTPDPLATPPILRQLRERLSQADRRPVVLIDGPVDPHFAFELFGRWRDELFAVPATWVVVAHASRLAEYLTPPADVFFDVVVTLDGLTSDQARDALATRGVVAALSDEGLKTVLETFDGTPRHLLRLARQHASGPARDVMSWAREHAAATAGLSRSAHMLLAEMQGRGPVAATDPDLGERLGISDRQMRRNLIELRDAGLVEPVAGARPGPGRPPATFQLTPLGRMGA